MIPGIVAGAPVPGGGGSTYATWNPADIAAGLSLSGGDLIVTRSGSGWAGVRANMGKSAGKWYYELYRSAGSDKAQTIYGTFALADTLSYPGHPGSNNASIGFQPLNTTDVNLYQDGFVGAFGSQADVPINGGIAIAIDVDAGSMWAKAIGAASWMGGGSPASGTSPTRTFTSGATIYPATGINLAGCACTANFGASAFIESAPSGFNSGWYT